MWEFDVFVPSKGRPNGSTFQLLKKSKIPFVAIVEKEDAVAYRQHGIENICILPKSRMGIGYSRWYIQAHVATRPFVMIDDDITQVYSYKNGELCTTRMTTMLKAGWKQFTKMGRRGLLGFKNTTFALRPDNPITIDTTVAHIVFMDRHPVVYDKTLRAFEDIDLMFKCRKAELPIVRLNTFVYYTTTSGMAPSGGISYTKSLKKNALKKVAERYPGWIRLIKDDTYHGQIRYELSWPRR
jgi:hypothetical protein